MKKIITPKVHEEVKYFCDNHPERECFSDLKTSSWYGSGWDMMGVEIHLCDECFSEVYQWIEEKFGIKPVDKELL